LKRKTQDTNDALTTKEIGRALKKLKNNKAPGTDNIPAVLLKFGGDRLKQWLKHMFLSIWIKAMKKSQKSGFKELHVHCIKRWPVGIC